MTGRRLPPTASVADQTTGEKLHAPAAARNADALSDLLVRVAPASGIALELASGTGQHIVRFAARMPALTWQPTELAPDRLSSIASYVREAALPNLCAPVRVNATEAGWAQEHSADLIVLINLTHLISATETQTLLNEVGRALRPKGRFMLYGPFKRDGVLTSDGDRAFDASLRASDPEIGYKNDKDIGTWLQHAGLHLAETVDMPANNLALIAQAG